MMPVALNRALDPGPFMHLTALEEAEMTPGR
jgi:hypothetical protein